MERNQNGEDVVKGTTMAKPIADSITRLRDNSDRYKRLEKTIGQQRLRFVLNLHQKEVDSRNFAKMKAKTREPISFKKRIDKQQVQEQIKELRN